MLFSSCPNQTQGLKKRLHFVAAKAKGNGEFGGEAGDFLLDFGGALGEGFEHAIARFGAEADHLHGGHHQRKLIVDFVAHVRKLEVQVSQLVRA